MDEHTTERPVLVVGAGPTGLTAALELTRLGIEVRIVDKALEPSTSSRALGIQARTVELLRPRGVGEEMLGLGNRARSATLYGGGRRLAAIELHRMPSRYNYILVLAQSETERLLTELLKRQGVKVERGVELVSFDHVRADDHAVRAVLRGGDGSQENFDASYLIAADGSHSATRKALGLPFDGTELEQQYLLGDLHIDGDIPEDQLSIFLASDGFLAVFPMGNKRFRFMATNPNGSWDDDRDPTIHELQHVFDRVTRLPATLHEMNWSSRFRINSRHMSTLRAGRVFFGGDAAHVHSPAGGQGMNAGIQDMINLSWKLAMVIKGQAAPALLDTYQSDRLPVIRDLVRMTERATALFNSTNPVVHQLLARLAPVVLATPAVQTPLARKLGQLCATYRGCRIAQHGGRIGRLRAGDRVPDVDLKMTGQPGFTRLYDELDLAALTLFVIGGPPDETTVPEHFAPWHEVLTVRHVSIAAVQRVARGLDATIARQLAGRPALLLIRPDGYVAAAARRDDPTTLTEWLGKWFVPATTSPGPTLA
jgi:2-polyprenyl-6-methoxyphenol hydroxylase-like FAD-dependent oxidoreductase